MKTARIAIIGAGLSGLYAAYLLGKQGNEDYVVLEAKPTLGGRIHSVPGFEGIDRFDLGPTWFWPQYQTELDHLLRELQLTPFPQHIEGDTLVERQGESVVRTKGFASAPESVRLLGGMASLVDRLALGIPAERLAVGQVVRSIELDDQGISITTEPTLGDVSSSTSAAMPTTYQAERVLLALPPRLATSTIHFSPALPEPLARAWQETGTWMAPHAKYVAVYDEPFWREQGLSGAAMSGRGPMVEIHDASTPGGLAALFGFIGVPARTRQDIPDGVLLAHCRAQMMRLFGEAAGSPTSEVIKDWARDPFTATKADLNGVGQHAHAPSPAAATGPWRERLVGIASEWSPQFPGYVAGAIEAARIGVEAVVALRSAPPEAGANQV